MRGSKKFALLGGLATIVGGVFGLASSLKENDERNDAVREEAYRGGQQAYLDRCKELEAQQEEETEEDLSR